MRQPRQNVRVQVPQPAVQLLPLRTAQQGVNAPNSSHFCHRGHHRAAHFGAHRPARSTVAVKTLPKNALVEIDCVALV